MEKIRRPTFKVPEVVEPTSVVPQTSTFVKWIPLICAGAAAGISIVALQEIRKLRKEIMIIKKEPAVSEANELLSKRMESMESQLKCLTDFIKNRNEVDKEIEKVKTATAKTEPVIKNVVQPQREPVITIINNEEYEEVEVTDDESN
jgi:hypothetical protein